jgi:antitoxin ParD1/3/4
MTTLNISLPDTMKAYIDSQVINRGYSTSEEYLRDLVRKDQLHQAEQHLASLILDGLESGPAQLIDDNYWQQKRNALRERHQNK